jgi:hypothetical protein
MHCIQLILSCAFLAAIGKRKQPDASQSGEIKFRDMTFLHHDVRTALRGLKLEKPTPIQVRNQYWLVHLHDMV